MAIIKSGASSDTLTVGVTSKAAYVETRDAAGAATQNLKTYMASGAFTPPATPTELVTIYGSATKTIRVLSLKLGTVNTAAGSQVFVTAKRTAAAVSGTAVAATAVGADSADAAATAVVSHWTAAPTAGAGTTIVTKKVASTVPTPTTFAGIRDDSDVEMLPQVNGQAKSIILRGVLEGVAVNFAAAALVAGQIHTYNVVWTEE